MNRRRFLALLTACSGLVTAGVVGVASVITAVSPVLKRRPGENWVRVGAVEDFPVGEVSKAAVRAPREDWDQGLLERGVFVWRRSENETVVFSRNCTDLSCPVTWDSGSGWFFCPCHGGIFDEEGQVRAGPPSRPLFRYAHRVGDGDLEIDLNSLPPMT